MSESIAGALRTKFGLAAPALRAAAAELWQLPGLGQRYPEYLRTMHGVIRASVPLMELAARRCADLGTRDPVAGPLRGYLEEHIAEEVGHDGWLLADLAALGADPTQPLREQPSPIVARLVGAQYYWIEHHHPVALLGYIAVMEGNAPAVWFADWIVSTTGVPEAAIRTLREHADLDPGHADAVFDLLDALAVTAAQATAVAVSGLYTMDALMALFAHIVRVSDSPVKGDRA
jgi:hypothetical protein